MRFVFPKETEPLAMPMEERIRLDDNEGLFPPPNAIREEEQPEAVTAIETRAYDPALQNEELVSQQRIFREELRAAERQIGECPDEQRSVNWNRAKAEELIGGGKQKRV